MKLEWKDEFSVNVKEIDKQHKREIQIINKLMEAINSMQTKQKLAGIIDELISYSNLHFGTEEKYFDKFNYEEKNAHKAKHRFFIKKIMAFKTKISNNEMKISFELVDFLED